MLRDEITRIIADAVAGHQPPWRQPWRRKAAPTMPHNLHSRKNYRGINILLLLEASTRYGWKSPVWGTERQWAAVGATIKRPPAHIPMSDWGCRIVFYSDVPQPGGKSALVMRSYTVYNLDQVKGGRSNKFAVLPASFESWSPAEELLSVATIRHGGDEAFYDEESDWIALPERDDFDSEADYYETAFHEVVHWAQKDGRVRKHPFYKDNYPFNELVAEIGACFLALETRLPFARKLLPECAKYIKSWLAAMGDDPRYIFAASSQASKVTDYLLKDARKCRTRSISVPMVAAHAS